MDIRQKLLHVSYEEVLKHGYNQCSLSNILEKSNVSKGALYHYFHSKKDLVICMIEEVISNIIFQKWQKISQLDTNIIDGIINNIDCEYIDFENGCPLGNLLQEKLEDDICDALIHTLYTWQEIIQNALQKAVVSKQIKNINPKDTSLFIIASLQGSLMLNKKTKSNEIFKSSINCLCDYLQSLKI